jgi:hypothetical protein
MFVTRCIGAAEQAEVHRELHQARAGGSNGGGGEVAY